MVRHLHRLQLLRQHRLLLREDGSANVVLKIQASSVRNAVSLSLHQLRQQAGYADAVRQIKGSSVRNVVHQSLQEHLSTSVTSVDGLQKILTTHLSSVRNAETVLMMVISNKDIQSVNDMTEE